MYKRAQQLALDKKRLPGCLYSNRIALEASGEGNTLPISEGTNMLYDAIAERSIALSPGTWLL